MSDEPDVNPSTVLEASVNKFGELHLDRERTEALLRYMRVLEGTVKKQQEAVRGLEGLLEFLKQSDSIRQRK